MKNYKNPPNCKLCGNSKELISPPGKFNLSYAICPICESETYMEVITLNEFMNFINGDKIIKKPIDQGSNMFWYIIKQILFYIKQREYKNLIYNTLKEKTKYSCGMISDWYPMYLSTDELRYYIPLSNKKIKWLCSHDERIKEGTYKNRVDVKINKKKYWAIKEFMKSAKWEFTDYERTFRNGEF